MFYLVFFLLFEEQYNEANIDEGSLSCFNVVSEFCGNVGFVLWCYEDEDI